MNDLEQIKVDLIYLAKRQKIIEDAVIQIEDALLELNQNIHEWSEFLTAELLKQGIRIHKNTRSFEFFRSSLGDTHKQTFLEIESLSLKIKQLFGKRKLRYTKYD